MAKSELIYILKSWLFWFVELLIVLFFAQKFIPLQKNFLGLVPFSNFDGEHYVSIATRGYGFGEHAFFPLYPLLISLIGRIFGGTIFSFTYTGMGISLISFLLGLIGFYKLAKIDYSQKISKIAVVILLLFPTSFYFVSVYTESLFFALAIWSFVFAREKKWLVASVLGILLTATRFVGLIIFPCLLIEWYMELPDKKKLLNKFPWSILTIPLGLLAYMYYLLKTIGKPFAFYNELSGFGEQRSSHLITLPQVYYRYIAKILPSLNFLYFPVVFTTFFEFLIGVIYLILSVFAFWRVRLSYALFILFGYLIPTFSGSFSSLPRYVLILFPLYFIFAEIFSKNKRLLVAFSFISAILLVISWALFARGYWIS